MDTAVSSLSYRQITINGDFEYSQNQDPVKWTFTSSLLPVATVPLGSCSPAGFRIASSTSSLCSNVTSPAPFHGANALVRRRLPT
jgi:hypothetical protein